MSDNNFDKTQFKPPVSWLMGRELLAGLKWIMAYSFMGDKQDAKDWMHAQEINTHEQHPKGSPFWFDYIADTGDGMHAVYNIAYLAMSDLWLAGQNNLGRSNVALAGDDTHSQHLPRGGFLFVGGDAAYHIADTASLKERFQTPFNVAYFDLLRAGKSVDQRPIYAIPANHDYYDALDGFNRQFCKPVSDDTTYNPIQNDEKDPQLGLMGFKRSQTASYVALKLPFNWHLWGLDTQEGKLDKRQQAFFVSTFAPELVQQGALFDELKQEAVEQTLQSCVPDKLIVATPEPSTVFGKWAADTDAMASSFKRLGLTPCFLKQYNGQLADSQCRLDISGDIHHYERYWGNTPELSQSNYASVVAGGGGAFLHPSQTDLNQVKKQVVYPTPKESQVLMTETLLKPQNILGGGYVWLAGGILAFLSYFAVTLPVSTASLFGTTAWPISGTLGILPHIKQALDVSITANALNCCSAYHFFDLSYIVLFITFLGYWLWQTPQFFNKQSEKDGKKTTIKYANEQTWRQAVKGFRRPVLLGVLPLLAFMFMAHEKLPHSFLASVLIDLFFVAAMLLFSLSRRYSDVLIARSRFYHESPVQSIPLWIPRLLGIAPLTFEATQLWIFNLLGSTFATFGFINYGVYSTSVMSVDLLMVVVWLLAGVGLIALAWFVPGTFTGKRLMFLCIGMWHASLQILVPVWLMLYASWPLLLTTIGVIFALTLLAGKVFSQGYFAKDNVTLTLALAEQKRFGYSLMACWGGLGATVLWVIKPSDPVEMDILRLLAAFAVGAIVSCIWFGWYLVVSLAFHGHNNEAGGGARSEKYRHLIRFKLTEDSLTGYVIGIDEPTTELTASSKFSLVDVFTIQVK